MGRAYSADYTFFVRHHSGASLDKGFAGAIVDFYKPVFIRNFDHLLFRRKP